MQPETEKNKKDISYSCALFFLSLYFLLEFFKYQDNISEKTVKQY